jgi:hypothetical protein
MLRTVPGRNAAEKAASLREAKRHGFRVVDKRIVVDGPRDNKRRPIKGATVEVLKGGIVKTSAGQRRDYIIGFTKKERQDFAAFPDAFIENKLIVLKRIFPSLRASRKPQIRIQWGAYQATKDFSPNYFTAKYFATISPEEKRRHKPGKREPRADKLTGLHIVVHVPKKKKSAPKKKSAKKKGKRRAKKRK